jgi:hypothetical protein
LFPWPRRGMLRRGGKGLHMRQTTAAALVGLAGGLPVHAQICPVEPLHAAAPGSWGGVAAVAVHADVEGTGVPRLYLAGRFERLGSVTGSGLLMREGGLWAEVAGAPASTNVMAVQREGGRDVLYVDQGPGYLPLRRYDGSWSDFAPLDFPISLVSVDVNGTGPMLRSLHFMESPFRCPKGAPGNGSAYFGAQGIWMGQSWQFLNWLDFPIGRYHLYRSPSSERAELYLPGWRKSYCFQPEGYVYRLTSAGWQSIAYDIDFAGVAANFDPDGSGPLPEVMVVGGSFTSLRLSPSGPAIGFNRVAAWNGASWSALGQGIPSSEAAGVHALGSFDPDGAGPLPRLLVAGGNFRSSAGAPGTGLAAWDGQSWSEFGGGAEGTIHLLEEVDDGPGGQNPALFANITGRLNGRPAGSFSMWRDGAWEGLLDGPDGPVFSLALFNEGAGHRLFAAGRFARSSGLAVNNIARWDGAQWSALGTGIEPTASNPNPMILATAVHNDGSGLALYVGGSFQSAGGVPASNVARWTGSQWQRVGQHGLSGGPVHALESHDPDGPGPLPRVLYAGGAFGAADFAPAHRLAVWDGEQWSAAGPVVQGAGAVRAIRSFQEPGGWALFVGGNPMSIGGLPVNVAFKRGPGGWESLPPLQAPGQSSRVNAFAYHDAGTGYQLHAIGAHLAQAENPLAQLDAGAWVILPSSGLPRPSWRSEGFAGRSVNDGLGPVLYANGERYAAGHGTIIRPEAIGRIRAISPVFDDGTGPSIFMSGEFSRVCAQGTPQEVGCVESAGIVRVRVCSTCYANCDGSTAMPLLNVLDFACFMQKFAAGDGYANCDGSTAPPVLNAADFACFLQRFSAGCP